MLHARQLSENNKLIYEAGTIFTSQLTHGWGGELRENANTLEKLKAAQTTVASSMGQPGHCYIL